MKIERKYPLKNSQQVLPASYIEELFWGYIGEILPSKKFDIYRKLRTHSELQESSINLEEAIIKVQINSYNEFYQKSNDLGLTVRDRYLFTKKGNPTPLFGIDMDPQVSNGKVSFNKFSKNPNFKKGLFENSVEYFLHNPVGKKVHLVYYSENPLADPIFFRTFLKTSNYYEKISQE